MVIWAIGVNACVCGPDVGQQAPPRAVVAHLGPAHPLADVSGPGASPAGLVQRLVHVVLHVLLAVRPGLVAQMTYMMHCAVENIGGYCLTHQGCVIHRNSQDAVHKPMLCELGA